MKDPIKTSHFARFVLHSGQSHRECGKSRLLHEKSTSMVREVWFPILRSIGANTSFRGTLSGQYSFWKRSPLGSAPPELRSHSPRQRFPTGSIDETWFWRFHRTARVHDITSRFVTRIEKFVQQFPVLRNGSPCLQFCLFHFEFFIPGNPV